MNTVYLIYFLATDRFAERNEVSVFVPFVLLMTRATAVQATFVLIVTYFRTRLWTWHETALSEPCQIGMSL